MSLLRRTLPTLLARCSARVVARALPLLVAAAPLALLLLPLVAHARAGGGQHYSSGGSSSSSSGGGGGDSSGLVWFLVELCIDHPLLGLTVIVIGGVVFIIQARGNGDSSTQKAIEAMAANDNAPRNLSGLTALKQRDPQFDTTKFTARVKQIIVDVNRAWAAGNMEPARKLVSDAVYLRFRTQLGILRAQGLRNALADFEVVDVDTVAVESDGDWDTIHVKLTGRVRDADVDARLSDSDAEKKAKSESLETFYEVWSMARRVGATTLQHGGTVENHCPNCGADLPPAASLRCEFCKAVVNSGTHDWVLAEITQIVEWQAGSTGNATIPGFPELKQRDAGFNREHAEDRASVLFWKWIEGRVLGDPRRLVQFASVDPEALGVRKLFPEPLDRVAVGAADLAACDPTPVDGLERCYVRVKWSAARGRSGQPVPMTNVLVLSRKVGLVTEPGRASMLCKECKGILAEGDSLTCQYCGASVAPGDQDWALEEVATPQAAERSRQERAAKGGAGAAATGASNVLDVPDLADPREREMMLWLMAGVLASDGVVQGAERKLLEQCAKRWNVPMAKLEPALNPAAWSQTNEGPLPGVRPEDRMPFLSGLVVAALVDGRIDAKERKLLDMVSNALQLPVGTVDQLVQTQQAKQQRRAG